MMDAAMIEPDGGMGNLIVALAGVAITMVIALRRIWFWDDKETGQKKRRQEIVERKADRWKLRENLRQTGKRKAEDRVTSDDSRERFKR